MGVHRQRLVWDQLTPLDKLTVTVVVDNETDGMSPGCSCCEAPEGGQNQVCDYKAELSRLVAAELAKGPAGCVDINNLCYAGHGLSILLTGEADGKLHTVVFDGGPSRDLWRHNAEKLPLPLCDVEAVVLSHWHVDHSGGLTEVVEAVSKARQKGIVVDLHPDRPARRGFMLDAGTVPLNPDPTFEELAQSGGLVMKESDEHTLLDDFFYVSGRILRQTGYETGIPRHGRMHEDGSWELDPDIWDERYLAVNIKGRGPIVFSACSHAGIVNVVLDVTEQAGMKPLAVIGGLHLAQRECLPRIDATMRDLKKIDPQLVMAGHCTGWRAKAALEKTFPGRYMPCVVGGIYTFLGRDDSSSATGMT